MFAVLYKGSCPQSAFNSKLVKSRWITCLEPCEVINGD